MEIKHMTGDVLFADDSTSIRETLLGAIKAHTSLSGANLSSADLSSADLSSADLSEVNLRGADLRNTIK